MAQVSVVIPVYNTEQHLRQCLDSVTAQTLEDLEIICVDDGSTDGSLQILEEYAARDNRIQVVGQANTGPGGARNAGLEKVRGKFLIFLDSDDWFEPDFLELMLQKAEQTNADVTICRSVEFDTETDRELHSDWMLKSRYLPGECFAPGDIAAHIFQFTYGWPWDKLYQTKFVLETQLQFPPLKNSEDLAFVFPSLLLAGRISVLDRALIHHRVNRCASVSNTRSCQPDAPYEASLILKDFLEKHGFMGRYQQSFLTWAIEFLVWHVSNINDILLRRQYLQLLRKEWFPCLLAGVHPFAYCQDKRTCCKYLLAEYAPWPVFCGAVEVFHKLKKWKAAR